MEQAVLFYLGLCEGAEHRRSFGIPLALEQQHSCLFLADGPFQSDNAVTLLRDDLPLLLGYGFQLHNPRLCQCRLLESLWDPLGIHLLAEI